MLWETDGPWLPDATMQWPVHGSQTLCKGCRCSSRLQQAGKPSRQQEPPRPTMWVNGDSLQIGLQKDAALALHRPSRGCQAAEQEPQQDGAYCCHLQSRR